MGTDLPFRLVAVILGDGQYTVRHRAHPAPRDADGIPVLSAPGDPQGPFYGASREVAQDSWSLRLDPAVWPLREGDIVAGHGRTWVVEGRPSLYVNNAAADVDYVSATATLSPEEPV